MTRRVILLILSAGLLAGCAPSGGGAASAAAAPAPAAPPAATSAYDRFAQLRAAVLTLPRADQQARLDAFIATEAASAEGFPLRAGTRATFVWKGLPRGSPMLAGGFNGWSATARALAPVGASDVWFAEVDLAAPDRWEYKLVIDGDWRPDPLNRKLSYDHGNSVVNLAGSGKSHLERLAAFPSAALGNARDVVVYLPEGYLDRPQERYPVLYMQDGQNLFDPAAPFGCWEVDRTCDRLIAQGALRRLIVVGVPPVDRFTEYTHVPDCVGGSTVGGGADRYARFLAQELKPAIDARYATLPARDETAILGSSLGGLVSLYAAYSFSGTFRNAGGMSSTLDWGSFCSRSTLLADLARTAGKLDLRIYVDSGGAGPSAPEDDNYGPTIDFRDLLASQGFRFGVDLVHFWEPNALHNEAAWRDRLEKPLLFWFKR